MIKMIRRQR